MLTVREIAKEIVVREGGYVNDPDDPGGATNFGVTIGTMRDLGIDLDLDGDVDVDDVKLMTADRATDIFINHYFFKPQIDKLPEVLHASVFDMQVNAGNNAIKLLQSVLNRFGSVTVVDGVLGRQTIGNCSAVYAEHGGYLVDAYAIERRNYYYRLGDKRPSLRKFAKTLKGQKGGWIKRAEEFMRDKYKYTDNDHKERTRRWV